VDGGGGYVNGGVPLNILDSTEGYNYGAAPTPIASLNCSGGTCTVNTSKPHGFACSIIKAFTLCPYVHTHSGALDITTKITAVTGATQYTFFLNGSQSSTGGTAQYAPDIINANITNQVWDSSWTAPPILSAIGTGVTYVERDNSVLDGLGVLRTEAKTKRR
jgi:hypothetical protein